MMLTAWKAVERATFPLLVALNSIPKVAVAPLLVVWLGYGPKPKIVLVVLICFFPIVVSTVAGLTSTPADLGELARSLSASWWQGYVKVRLPWALPQVFVGLKLGISLAVIGAVVAEISSPNQGLGAVIVLSGSSLDTPLAFAAIVLLALLSIVLFYLIVALERLLLPWARAISA
jgi:NitT/TauT family transport system permease protein